MTPPNTFTLWSPDAPPPDPSLIDDEFDDASFDTTLWTEFDPGAFLTVSEQEPGLILDHASDPGTDLAGIYQPVPPGNFAIIAKLHLIALSADFAPVGLALWEDATDPSKGLYHWRLLFSTADQSLQFTHWTNWQTWNAHLFTETNNIIATHVYLRVRRIGATYYMDWSSNGLGWRNCWSGGLAFAPDHFGILTNNDNTGITIRAMASFFRFIPYGVFNTILEGDRILETRHA